MKKLVLINTISMLILQVVLIGLKFANVMVCEWWVALLPIIILTSLVIANLIVFIIAINKL